MPNRCLIVWLTETNRRIHLRFCSARGAFPQVWSALHSIPSNVDMPQCSSVRIAGAPAARSCRYWLRLERTLDGTNESPRAVSCRYHRAALFYVSREAQAPQPYVLANVKVVTDDLTELFRPCQKTSFITHSNSSLEPPATPLEVADSIQDSRDSRRVASRSFRPAAGAARACYSALSYEIADRLRSTARFAQTILANQIRWVTTGHVPTRALQVGFNSPDHLDRQ